MMGMYKYAIVLYSIFCSLVPMTQAVSRPVCIRYLLCAPYWPYRNQGEGKFVLEQFPP